MPASRPTAVHATGEGGAGVSVSERLGSRQAPSLSTSSRIPGSHHYHHHTCTYTCSRTPDFYSLMLHLVSGFPVPVTCTSCQVPGFYSRPPPALSPSSSRTPGFVFSLMPHPHPGASNARHSSPGHLGSTYPIPGKTHKPSTPQLGCVMGQFLVPPPIPDTWVLNLNPILDTWVLSPSSSACSP